MKCRGPRIAKKYFKKTNKIPGATLPNICIIITLQSGSEVRIGQWCLTPCNPMDCSLPGSSVHEILQARILEWVSIPFSRGSSRLKD